MINMEEEIILRKESVMKGLWLSTTFTVGPKGDPEETIKVLEEASTPTFVPKAKFLLSSKGNAMPYAP